MKWVLVLGLVLAAAAGLWLAPRDRNDRERLEGGGVVAGSSVSAPSHDSARSPAAVGTSGTHDGAAESHYGDVITEIETITGTNDAMGLVGRRVDLHVDVQGRATDTAFWVGPRDNRLLVVLARDNRDGRERQKGRASHHRIVPVHGGQRAMIAGVIRQAPKPEDRYSWALTNAEDKELADRKVYIRADTVSSEGHGSR